MTEEEREREMHASLDSYKALKWVVEHPSPWVNICELEAALVDIIGGGQPHQTQGLLSSLFAMGVLDARDGCARPSATGLKHVLATYPEARQRAGFPKTLDELELSFSTCCPRCKEPRAHRAVTYAADFSNERDMAAEFLVECGMNVSRIDRKCLACTRSEHQGSAREGGEQ